MLYEVWTEICLLGLKDSTLRELLRKPQTKQNFLSLVWKLQGTFKFVLLSSGWNS